MHSNNNILEPEKRLASGKGCPLKKLTDSALNSINQKIHVGIYSVIKKKASWVL
jgi:hypothetical protein